MRQIIYRHHVLALVWARRGRILVMDSSGPITIGRSAPPTQTGIATVLRLQPPGDSRGVRWARAESCSISGELMPLKRARLAQIL